MSYSYMDVLAEFGIGSAHPGGFTLTKELLSQVAIHKQDHVLDCGCGTGQTASYLSSSFNCSVTALDIHPLMIEKARNRFNIEDQPITLIEGNVEAMPFEDQTFHYVLSESVTIFTNIDQTLNEYARVLKPNGTLLLNEMVLLERTTQDEEAELKEMYQASDFLFTDQWIKKLKAHGFSSVLSCIASPISALLAQSDDKGNDFFPSDVLDPALHDMLGKHHELSKSFASKLGFLLIIVQKT
ncbi:class I SAM-dependent methyltransferase [Alkalicoccobacillus murimartini]|uniref:Ubiquinone/menaquinone biosynthesis C-methylase UbiE n=1 Tax=Alkalicoccobacillus murimartini TaxID=171685 RepID=A0ABT9YF33_9BACI|nr:class I SAM-dependent methyltransferase [Alkalicoccobacillus murimartini]MDQ0206115.1 ubiquinone/menaquinone biosynthesis C-methylase UbiE [Alkalicoccobacillus murimartini]